MIDVYATATEIIVVRLRRGVLLRPRTNGLEQLAAGRSRPGQRISLG